MPWEAGRAANTTATCAGPIRRGTSERSARPFFTWQLEDFHAKAKIEIVLTAALERMACL
jgi:hypothetical protein